MPSSPPRMGWGFGVYEDPVEEGGWVGVGDGGQGGEGKVEVEVEVVGRGEGEVERVVRGLRVDGNGRAVVDFAGLSRDGGGE